MPRPTAINVQHDFKTGLITEASGLNYPDTACIVTDNCEFDLLGRVSRRAGFNFENGYTTQTVDKTLSSISTYFWRNVTGDGLLSFMVVQIGATLHFYNSANPTSLSAGHSSSTIDLTAFSPGGAPNPGVNECQFSDGFGKLFVVHPNLEAFYVTYDTSLATFSGTQIDLKIRDFEGMIDEQAFDARPTSTLAGLSDAHEYNLRNQGWNTTVLTAWDTAFTTMPSNCDVWWSYKNASDVFDTTTVANSAAGNTLANKGHYVLNVYNQDRTTASGITGITSVTTSTQRATATAFFAGRVWYAGINYPGFNTKIYFSRIAQSVTDFGLCYQQNDPTAQDLFDIEVDDGGVFNIPEAGTIYKLFVMQNALLVFAARGVWAITGSSGLGFTATDFTLRKISSHRTVSASSFVDVNGAPIYWNSDGIFTVQAQQVDANGQQQMAVTPMSFSTIQSFFDLIPNAAKSFARGFFNPQTQIVQWLYSSNAPSTTDDHYIFDKIMIFDVRSGAFYVWTLPTSSVSVHGIFVADAQGAQTQQYVVIDAAVENVIDAAGDTVVAFSQSEQTITPVFKYLVSYPFSGSYKFTMADQIDTTYTDWTSYDSVGVDYTSTFTTGYKIRGNAAIKFQSTYVFFYNEGDGMYDVQGIWDYAITGNTGKYTSKQRLNYNDISYSNMHKKIKLRGNGRTLQYKVTSVAGEPFTIIGWAAVESANLLA